MLEMAAVKCACPETIALQGFQVSHCERQLVQSYRQMTELEQRQIRRLIDQLVLHPESLAE
ncbi:hypothetical protein PSCICO_15160 [Pseudomonas cichorii]|nr:hypothetical protein PSCICO_15160 [Pseudomonas cichorii]